MLISRFFAMMVLASALASASVSAMELKLEGLKERLTLHLQEVHGCEKLQFVSDEPVGDEGWRFSIKNDTVIEIAMQRRGDVITSLQATSADQTDAALEDMMCLMVATMRTLQPDAIKIDDAFYEAAFFWARSKFERYSATFFTDTMTTQYVPLMFSVE